MIVGLKIKKTTNLFKFLNFVCAKNIFERWFDNIPDKSNVAKVTATNRNTSITNTMISLLTHRMFYYLILQKKTQLAKWCSIKRSITACDYLNKYSEIINDDFKCTFRIIEGRIAKRNANFIIYKSFITFIFFSIFQVGRLYN